MNSGIMDWLRAGGLAKRKHWDRRKAVGMVGGSLVFLRLVTFGDGRSQWEAEPFEAELTEADMHAGNWIRVNEPTKGGRE